MVCEMFLATAKHRRRRVPGTSKPPKYGNLFYGDGWAEVVESQHLNKGKRIVFTNLGGNSVGLISFARNGLGLLFEKIARTKLNDIVPIVRGPLDKGMLTSILKKSHTLVKMKFNVFSIIHCITDKRMFHVCDWDGHERHNNEDTCFYTPLAAYVTDRNRLVSSYYL